jgi:ketosteroid isomerase-like protein
MPLTETDYTEIRQLFARYSQTLDFGDAEGFLACFAADGVLDTSAPEDGLGGVHRGHDELRAYCAVAMEYSAGRVRQSAVNSLIDGDGASARATSYVIVTRDYGPPLVPGHVTYSVLVTTGMYFDELIKADGRWVFSRREFRHDGLPDVLERVGESVVVGPAPRVAA